jgi:hypothetical protein
VLTAAELNDKRECSNVCRRWFKADCDVHCILLCMISLLSQHRGDDFRCNRQLLPQVRSRVLHNQYGPSMCYLLRLAPPLLESNSRAVASGAVSQQTYLTPLQFGLLDIHASSLQVGEVCTPSLYSYQVIKRAPGLLLHAACIH